MLLGEPLETLADGPDAVLRHTVNVRGHLAQAFD